MSAKDLLNRGSRWTDTRARVSFPLLLGLAEAGKTIEYGQLNDLLVSEGLSSAIPVAYRYPMGKVGDICRALSTDLDERIPPLNAIVVNSQTHLPSDGVDDYVEEFLGLSRNSLSKMTVAERDAYAEQAIQTVHDYSGWPRIRAALSLRPQRPSKKGSRGGIIPLPNPRSFSTGTESTAHKALKDWVANNGSHFGEFKKGEKEKQLASGDRLDVFFANDTLWLAVEVKTKNAPDAEIQRGVYQCVKYRATLRAMQLATELPPNAAAILVIDKEPPEIVAKLADRLSVSIIPVRNYVGPRD